MFIHPCPIHQADAVLNQANPVSGTKYPVLDTTKNVKIISCTVRCTWTVQPDPIEIHVTIDGQSKSASFPDPISNAEYHLNFYPSSANFGLDATKLAGEMTPLSLEGRSIKIEAEITGGTVSNLLARVKHAKW